MTNPDGAPTAMSPRTTIYYHADCLDGFGAAYAAWRRLRGRARYVALRYGGSSWQPDDVAGREVFVLDFSFPPDELRKLAAHARFVHVIDHHVTALDAWRDVLVPDGASGRMVYRDPAHRLALTFDLGKSGARLAWEHFHPDAPVPAAIARIEDHDLWRFRYEDTRPFCRALRLRPFDFGAWDEIVRTAERPDDPGYLALRGEGESIERFLRGEVERLAWGSLVTPATLRGEPCDPLQARRHGQALVTVGDLAWTAVRGLAANATSLFASELGHQLAVRSGSFGLVWQFADGQVRASLRADGKVDVARLAQHYGGGGHPNAAGFRMPLAQFIDEVLARRPDARG